MGNAAKATQHRHRTCSRDSKTWLTRSSTVQKGHRTNLTHQMDIEPSDCTYRLWFRVKWKTTRKLTKRNRRERVGRSATWHRKIACLVHFAYFWPEKCENFMKSPKQPTKPKVNIASSCATVPITSEEFQWSRHYLQYLLRPFKPQHCGLRRSTSSESF